MIVLSHFRLLPLLVLVALLSFGVRALEFYAGASDFGSARAQEKSMAEVDIQPPMLAPDMPDMSDVKDSLEAAMNEGDGDSDDDINLDFLNGDDERWLSSEDTDLLDSSVQAELVKTLASRRKILEQKEKSLRAKEAVLKATEKQIEQKISELGKLKREMEELLDKQTEEEEEQVLSLVKIYEGMKAKDAARIFNTLEISVLMQVISRMSERKASPIMAAMNPDRARNVTILLAERKKLPEFPN